MKRTTIFIEEPMERELAALAEQQDRPRAALVREALGEYLARHHRGGRRLGFAAIGGSGRRDTAASHDEILWGGAGDEEPSPGGGVPPAGYLPRQS